MLTSKEKHTVTHETFFFFFFVDDAVFAMNGTSQKTYIKAASVSAKQAAH